jgi:hypothetical protein
MAAPTHTPGVTIVHVRANGRARPGTLDIEVLARQAGMHPDLVRRLVRLGLVGSPFPLDAAASLARAARLRRDLGLNYAGAVLAVELLARIDELEARLRRYEPPETRAR